VGRTVTLDLISCRIFSLYIEYGSMSPLAQESLFFFLFLRSFFLGFLDFMAPMKWIRFLCVAMSFLFFLSSVEQLDW